MIGIGDLRRPVFPGGYQSYNRLLTDIDRCHAYRHV